MSIDRARHGRQIRLPEIGEAGQARLVATRPRARTSAPNAHSVEVAYLEAAGVHVETSGAPDESDARALAAALDRLGVSDPAARGVAEGALAALMTMRAALGIEGAGEARRS